MTDYVAATAPDTLRLERVLPGPIERVWAYLTESEKRGTWLARGEIELREGGRVELQFQHRELTSHDEVPPERYRQFEEGSTVYGQVVRCEPPRLLSYTWREAEGYDSEVTFELTPRGSEVRLVLTHRKLGDRPTMVGAASGWHVHVDILAARLAGEEPAPFWVNQARLESEYDQRLPAEGGQGGAP